MVDGQEASLPGPFQMYEAAGSIVELKLVNVLPKYVAPTVPDAVMILVERPDCPKGTRAELPVLITR